MADSVTGKPKAELLQWHAQTGTIDEMGSNITIDYIPLVEYNGETS
ncbi:MAG: hypothetical protein NC548_44680 [Lachnospiraceae bacterium]|nr:hypothetical protein [Lachnospiraceae bacterium]